MQSRKNKTRAIQWDKYMVYIIFVVVFILFAIFLGGKGFLGASNLMNILRQTSMISVMAVAGVFVMAAGQIDLTVGAVAAMTAMLVSLILRSTNSIPLALIAGLGFGAAVGCVNGLLVTKLGLPAFLATMGMMQIVRGSAMWITDTAAVPIDNKAFNTVFGICLLYTSVLAAGPLVRSEEHRAVFYGDFYPAFLGHTDQRRPDFLENCQIFF